MIFIILLVTIVELVIKSYFSFESSNLNMADSIPALFKRSSKLHSAAITLAIWFNLALRSASVSPLISATCSLQLEKVTFIKSYFHLSLYEILSQTCLCWAVARLVSLIQQRFPSVDSRRKIF